MDPLENGCLSGGPIITCTSTEDLEELDDLHDLLNGGDYERKHECLILRRRNSLPDASEKRKSMSKEELEALQNLQFPADLKQANSCTAVPQRRALGRAASSGKVQYAMIRAAISEDSRLELQTLLRRRDVRVNEIEPDGFAAIHFAAMYGTCETVEILMNEGAKINFPSTGGEYPLDLAVRTGNFEIAQFLIEKGARLDNVINGTPAVNDHRNKMGRMKSRAYTIDTASLDVHT